MGFAPLYTRKAQNACILLPSARAACISRSRSRADGAITASGLQARSSCFGQPFKGQPDREGETNRGVGCLEPPCPPSERAYQRLAKRVYASAIAAAAVLVSSSVLKRPMPMRIVR